MQIFPNVHAGVQQEVHVGSFWVQLFLQRLACFPSKARCDKSRMRASRKVPEGNSFVDRSISLQQMKTQVDYQVEAWRHSPSECYQRIHVSHGITKARSRHGMALSIIIMQNVGGKEEILILDITSKGLSIVLKCLINLFHSSRLQVLPESRCLPRIINTGHNNT